jgi:N-acetyl-gamma-glutamyl-phosphate reductase
MINVAIIGASGYSGSELLRILLRHPEVSVTTVTAASSAGLPVDQVYPALTGECELTYKPLLPDDLAGADVAFVALPSGEAMKIMPKLQTMVGKVIDLGGDFRLKDTAQYEKYYKHQHASPEFLPGAVYGLPELNREAIANATLVSNPGCYATSIILGLLPLAAQGLVSLKGISVAAVSGISGAGRSSSVDMSFTELNENVRAYKLTTHQHVPEIEQALAAAASGAEVTVSFVPHLVPITRGIHSTIHATLTKESDARAIQDAFALYYALHPFVRVRKNPVQIAAVTRTNFCDIHPVVEARTGQVVITSVIDNLVKGAAGQAIQNMNLMFGLKETTGL